MYYLFLDYYYILLFVCWFQQVGEEVGNSKLYAYYDNIQIMLHRYEEAWKYRMHVCVCSDNIPLFK